MPSFTKSLNWGAGFQKSITEAGPWSENWLFTNRKNSQREKSYNSIHNILGLLVQIAIFADLLQDTSFNFGSPNFNFYTPYKIFTNSQLSHFYL